jgi:hypothetical protein
MINLVKNNFQELEAFGAMARQQLFGFINILPKINLFVEFTCL